MGLTYYYKANDSRGYESDNLIIDNCPSAKSENQILLIVLSHSSSCVHHAGILAPSLTSKIEIFTVGAIPDNGIYRNAIIHPKTDKTAF